MNANPRRTSVLALVLLLSVMVVVLLATTQHAQQLQPPLAAAPDVELWTAALEQFQRENQQRDLAIVDETLASADFTSRLLDVAREQRLVEKLLKRNESSLRFSAGLMSSSAVELVDVTTIRKPGAADIDWNAIGTQFKLRKKRLVRLSLPVFSDDNMRALVYVWSTGGFDDSSGGGYVFQKRDGGWIIVDYLAPWIN